MKGVGTPVAEESSFALSLGSRDVLPIFTRLGKDGFIIT
jgi:hypothetical protein